MAPARVFRTTGFRLAAMYAALFAVSALTLFGVIYWISGDALRQQMSANVSAEVTALAGDYRANGLDHIATNIRDRIASGSHRTTFYLLLDPQGRKVAGNMPAAKPRAGWQHLPFPASRISGDRALPDDGIERGLLAFGKTLDGGGFILVGEDTFPIVEVEEAIARAFGWAFGVTVVLGIAGGILLSSGFLRRIDAINRTSRAIVEGRLTDRVPTRGTDDELDRLSVNLNEMLDRIQGLVQTLQQVSSDIAHDLRTPLSRLRQRLEGARMNAHSVADYQAATDQAIADTDAILKTFAALLRIAQIESGSRQAVFSTVDLTSVFQTVADTYGAVAEDHGQRLSAEIEPDIRLRGDRELLTQMLVNLVENAIRHTPANAHIWLKLSRQAEGPVGIVADDGPGIPEEAHDEVFRRFYRLERSRSTAGNGLGLSLVAAVAQLHGVTVALTDNRPGLQVRLGFPAEGEA